MTSRNDITGDLLASRTNSDQYRDNWEVIFGKKKPAPEPAAPPAEPIEQPKEDNGASETV